MTYGTLINQIVLRDKTHLASSKDEFRPAMLHLYIKDRFCFATDSFIMAVGRIQEDFAKEPTFEGIIPIEIVNQFWKSKSAYKRIDIWESKNEYNQKQILASCDDLVKPLIDEIFPPIIEWLYRRLNLYNTFEDETFKVTFNPEYLLKVASAQGQPKGQIDLVFYKKENLAFVRCESSVSNDSNFGILTLCKEGYLDINSDFWIKELSNLADEEQINKWDEEINKEIFKISKVRTDKALSRRKKEISEQEAEENQFILEYIKKYYEEVYDEAEAHITNKNIDEISEALSTL
jgi:hypothetical protein